MVGVMVVEHALVLEVTDELLGKGELLALGARGGVEGRQSTHSHCPQLLNCMKQTVPPQKVLTRSSKGESATGQAQKLQPQKSKKEQVKKTKYKIDAITKDNFEASSGKMNITEIKELPLKYVLKCIDGLYKNRYIFITTHP